MQRLLPALKKAALPLLLIPYLFYIGFVVTTGRGPIDYLTFMEIGNRLWNGQPVYGVNSYYPMLFVMIFAAFSWMPYWASITLWLLLPVIAALIITGGSPWVLVFAPLFGHFLGGQTAIFGMIGLWGFRKYASRRPILSGIFLALALLKPQLGLIPLVFALIQWTGEMFRTKRLPPGARSWALCMLVFYLPGFLLNPNWPAEWLANPRSLSLRAMSGLGPRTLAYLLPPSSDLFWLLLALISTTLMVLIWVLNRRKLTLDLGVIWSLVVSPLVHDYDLITLIPLLEDRGVRLAAILASIPGWVVILFFYEHDAAWFAFTLIAPAVLIVSLIRSQTTQTTKILPSA